MGRLADDAFLKEEHKILREQVRRFVSERSAPHVAVLGDLSG